MQDFNEQQGQTFGLLEVGRNEAYYSPAEFLQW